MVIHLGADCARETLVLDPPSVREKGVTMLARKAIWRRRSQGRMEVTHVLNPVLNQEKVDHLIMTGPAFHPPVQSPGMPLHVNFHIQDSSNKIAENDMSMKLPDLSHGGQDI
ncbi:unnamed protein product [Ilex paraguariensis]|uniref:Uncharacterized protein n=1 Tax=Ilex paraguariensis TaxID=185542 RepID=A0ABC8TNL9_9AQUA